MSRVATLIALVSLTTTYEAQAQGIAEVKARYTKFEYLIPMRDGVKLFTAVYVPKDADRTAYPIMLNRTPYSVQPYGVDQYKPDLGPNPMFGREGYIFAYQDVRGRWMSEGNFVNVRPEKDGVSKFDESTDTFDTIDWLLKNVEGHNGRVGMSGISYPGFYTACGAIDAHPALKAASPQAPVIDWFMGDDWHHNGAFMVTHCFNFMSVFGHPRPYPVKSIDRKFDHGTPDGYDFFLDLGPLSNVDTKYFQGDVAFWNEVMDHPNYDSFWKARNLRTQLKRIKPAVMTVGGWFDAENLYGALETYKTIEASSPNASNMLVMGPWFHGGWERSDGESLGHVSFNSKTAEYYREKVELQFFGKHLKDHVYPEGDLPEALVFETGTNRWKRYDQWPPKDAKPKTIYLQENGVLGFEPAAEGFDEYVSDPAHPVPYIDEINNRMTREYMVGDQRFASKRPDVVTYKTPELKADITVAGPIKVTLHVSTTGTDSDWIVKLIDVYPLDTPDPNPNTTGVKMGGFQQLVRGDVMRGKFREGFDEPHAFTPGEPTEVTFTMPDINHVFRPGHRLMVQVQSTWFPLIDRNPQTFVDIYKAKPADFRKATQRMYHSKTRPSRLEMGMK